MKNISHGENKIISDVDSRTTSTPPETVFCFSDLIQEINRSHIDNANDLIQSNTADGKIAYANQKWLDALGYSLEDLPSLNISDIIQEDYLPQCLAKLEKIASGEKKEFIETVLKTKNNREVYVEGNISGLFKNGRFVSTICVFRDITRRKRAEETYSLLVFNSPIPIYVVQNGGFHFVNPSFQTLTEYSKEELLGKNPMDFVHPQDREYVYKNAVRMLKSSRPSTYEFRILRKSGEIRWVMETVISIPFESGRATLGTMVDLTERRMVESALEEAKNRYRAIFNSVQDAIFINDTKNNLIEINEAVCRLFGYPRQAYFDPKGECLKSMGAILSSLNGSTESDNNSSEAEIRTCSGRRIPVEYSRRYLEYEKQKAILTVVRDISERKQVENIRRRNQARLESLIRIAQFKPGHTQDLLYFALDEVIKLSSSKIGFLYFYNSQNQEFAFSSWSKDLLRLQSMKKGTGTCKLEETGILGHAIRQGKAFFLNQAQEPDLLLNGYPEGPYQIEKYLLIPVVRGQEIVAVISVANKEQDYDEFDIQQLTLVLDSVWNILDRWKSDEALRDSEYRYRQLIELSQDAILRMDANGFIVMANPTACQMFGYSDKEFLGSSFARTYPPEDSYLADMRLDRARTEEKMQFERMALRKDGSRIPIEVSISPLTHGYFQEVIRDITERKKMENALAESEKKYRLIVENQTDMIIEINPSGNFTFVNPAFCKLLGKGKEELLGTDPILQLYEDDRQRSGKELKVVFEPPYTIQTENRVVTPNGWRWIAWTGNAVLDDQHKIIAITLLGRDITESKLAREELEKANQQLRELDKLKDNLLSTVSHELRTPLTSIKSFAELLLNYEEDKATQKEFLGIINHESDRLMRLINDFLDLSKIQAGRMQWNTVKLSVEDAITSAVTAIQPLIKKSGLELLTYLESGLPYVLCDMDRLIQVITNLIGNAVKFTPENGIITLRAWFDKSNNDLKEAWVTVSITDTGIGIAPENHQKIFEKFGQVGDVLKDRPKGTGLGLPICKKIVENYGGKIWVQSNIGQGSTFFFTLPAVNSNIPEVPIEQSVSPV